MGITRSANERGHIHNGRIALSYNKNQGKRTINTDLLSMLNTTRNYLNSFDENDDDEVYFKKMMEEMMNVLSDPAIPTVTHEGRINTELTDKMEATGLISFFKSKNDKKDYLLYEDLLSYYSKKLSEILGKEIILPNPNDLIGKDIFVGGKIYGKYFILMGISEKGKTIESYYVNK